MILMSFPCSQASNYKSTPPGFQCGMTFEETPSTDPGGNRQSGNSASLPGSTSTMINLADVMADMDDLDLGDSDADEEGDLEQEIDNQVKISDFFHQILNFMISIKFLFLLKTFFLGRF